MACTIDHCDENGRIEVLVHAVLTGTPTGRLSLMQLDAADLLVVQHFVPDGDGLEASHEVDLTMADIDALMPMVQRTSDALTGTTTVVKTCPRCGRELRPWALDRGDKCSPKDWAYCIRPES
jgi:hypothetical protein